MNACISIVGSLLLLALCYSVQITSCIAKKVVKVSDRQTIVAFLFCTSAVLFAVAIFMSGPVLGKVSLVLIGFGLIVMMMLGIMSLAFISIIPENMEKESDNE